MKWNWQQPDWPEFRWDSSVLAKAEAMFLRGTGLLAGVSIHLDKAESDRALVEALSIEAVTTSEIEGEFLNRASVQSSIQQQLGMATGKRQVPPAERGIAEMMVSSYREVENDLSQDTLFCWHAMVMAGRSDLRDVGRFRSGAGPMQVVSGAVSARKIHFEAPPSSRVAKEMSSFLHWFNS